MSGSNNSGSNTSKMAVPQAKEAMNRFKQEVASEIGVPLKEGYNGDLTREFDTLKSKKVPQSLEIGLFFCQIFIFII